MLQLAAHEQLLKYTKAKTYRRNTAYRQFQRTSNGRWSMPLTASSDSLLPPPHHATLSAGKRPARKTIPPNPLTSSRITSRIFTSDVCTNDSRQEGRNENNYINGGQMSRANVKSRNAKHRQRHTHHNAYKRLGNREARRKQQTCCIEESRRGGAYQVPFFLSRKRVSMPSYICVRQPKLRKPVTEL